MSQLPSQTQSSARERGHHMNVITALPMKDELADGIAGRFIRLNGFQDERTAISTLRAGLAQPTSTPALETLAVACNLPLPDLIRWHSLLPVARAISAHAGTASEARVAAQRLERCRFGTPRSQVALFCPACKDEDRRRYGFAYWRRQHHLPAVDWCPTHGTPLVGCAKGSFATQPGQRPALSAAQAVYPRRSEDSTPALQRYLSILQGWADAARPIPVMALNEVLRNRCESLNLRRGEVGRRPTISDAACDALPKSWLERHHPDLLNRRPGDYVRRFDGAAVDRHLAYPSDTCALILAVLFDTTAEPFALLAVETSRLKADQEPGPCSAHLLESATMAFINGMGIGEASAKHGVPVQRLEAMLRQSLSRRTVEAA